MEKQYTSYDQLPLILNACDVAKVLGISRSAAYSILHNCKFPTIKIGKRMVVPRDKFIEWIDSCPQC